MSRTVSDEIQHLAAAAGLQRNWRDVEGREQVVSDTALAAILEALGHETGSARKRKASLARIEESQAFQQTTLNGTLDIGPTTTATSFRWGTSSTLATSTTVTHP